jgi:hypothetical protein
MTCALGYLRADASRWRLILLAVGRFWGKLLRIKVWI